MPKKLKTYVHVVDRDDKGNTTRSGTFGPDDDLTGDNAWVVDAVDNPDVWADDSDDGPDPDDQDAQLIQAPNGGQGLEGSTQLDYDELTLPNLRAELKRRDLPIDGNKPDLVARLREHDQARTQQ